MPSTSEHLGADLPEWRLQGWRYYPIGVFLRRLFSGRVRKISVDAGFDCPNRDGTSGRNGCIFCDPASYSPSRRLSDAADPGQVSHVEHLAVGSAECPPAGLSIGQQIERGAALVRRKHRVDGFLAYLQPATNTYAPVERLRKVYEEALRCPEVVGIVIGTRPDCVSDEVLDLCEVLSRQTFLVVEYGVQSMHDRSLAWLGRGHDAAASANAIARSRSRGLRVGAHVILGLPGETVDDMLATADWLAELGVHSVKIHQLYVVRQTELARRYAAGELILPSAEQYVDAAVRFLERLPADCVIERLQADVGPEYLVAPDWAADGRRVRRAIEAELERRGTWQGREREND